MKMKMKVEFVFDMQNIFPDYTVSKPRIRNKKCITAACTFKNGYWCFRKLEVLVIF